VRRTVAPRVRVIQTGFFGQPSEFLGRRDLLKADVAAAE
jgi:hypothetical protein